MFGSFRARDQASHMIMCLAYPLLGFGVAIEGNLKLLLQSSCLTDEHFIKRSIELREYDISMLENSAVVFINVL